MYASGVRAIHGLRESEHATRVDKIMGEIKPSHGA